MDVSGNQVAPVRTTRPALTAAPGTTRRRLQTKAVAKDFLDAWIQMLHSPQSTENPNPSTH